MNFQSSIIHSPLEAVPPGYKRTEVGVIPEDWGVKALCQIGSFLKGRGIKRDDVADDGMPCIRYGEIYTRYNDYVFDPVSRIPPSVALKSEPLKSGDLLFAGSGETAEEIGKCVAFLGKETAFAGGDIVILRPNGQDSLYLGHLFNHDVVVQQKARLGQGDAVVHISARNLSTVRIPLPSITEQRAIAEALSDVDGLIAALDKLIAKKRAIKQAAMQQLLTGKTRLPGFSGEWETKRLINECELITKGTTPTSISRGFTTQGVNFVKVESITSDGTLIWDQVAHIDEETHTLLKRSQLKSNDILFSIAGALGRNAIVHESWLPANTNQALAIIRLRSSSTLRHDFLVKYLASPQLVSHVEAINVKAAQANISLADVGGFTIRTPSPEEQTAIATVLSDMDAGIAALEARRDKVKRIKQGMMQQLLTGRVRLVKPLAEEARA